MSLNHNHQRCIDDAMAMARHRCSERGARLTPIRADILKLIWASHQPVGAYDLLESLSARSERRSTPPTVYRALDFLLEQGLIHRIASLNAFVGCNDPGHGHSGHFLICKDCNNATELLADGIGTAIQSAARQQDFTIDSQSVEIVGRCKHCAGQND
ncbi:MAG: Fur family transcriptional regulator [Spongiibacter sp.]|uniref:Ferric uptake regulation protein n=1 Tax=Spongiibacter thalassae TaxID=2721624 RepID=A0ABX1GGL3_9GAMM|nr:Fur family transcriptional regulator [Spongiibacter thalassae]MDX1505099.1 Fur family transcriptional regulator [Spongiibacter sp.]NKI18350.1 transcriptional repressor [Spongiibacter thalassae]